MTGIPTATSTSERLAANLATLQARITAACERADRNPRHVTLIAITKTFSPPLIRAAYRAGQRDFGENRIEEASGKIPPLRSELPDACWHMVGHVQSRKAAAVPPLFDCLHSLDSLKLARRLGRFASEQGQRLPVLIQCNVSGEASKSGFPAQGWRADRGIYRRLCDDFRAIAALPGLDIQGLMTMAPFQAHPEATRRYFASLASLAAALRDELSLPLPQLSMGMTNDYEIAIEEGATHLRIGRAIFGDRLPTKAVHTEKEQSQ